jgi:hypothetical protein
MGVENQLGKQNGLLHLTFGWCHSDRYSQASTYGQLELLAEAQEDHTEARANLQKALEIYVEYKDVYWLALHGKY